jgi:N-acetylglucosamine malate deacetylase 1
LIETAKTGPGYHVRAVTALMAIDVLLFGAHPDDVEWAVGGTALLLHDKGLSFALVDMTNGEMGSRGTVEERKIEAARAAELMGACARENLNLPDCGLVDSPENRRLVASAVRRFRPRMVLAPLWEDRHPDHAAAGLIVRNAQLYCELKSLEDPCPPHKVSAFLFYPIHRFRSPSFVVDTAGVFERKMELLRIFDSQFADVVGGQDFLFRLESRDRYFGSLAGSRYGEALVLDSPLRVGGLEDVCSLLR